MTTCDTCGTLRFKRYTAVVDQHGQLLRWVTDETRIEAIARVLHLRRPTRGAHR